MKCTSLVLFFSLIVISVFPQNMHYVDSLKKALSQSEEDTNKVKLYANLSWEYQFSYPDSALSYSLPGLQLAKKLHFEEGEFDNLTSLGMSLTLKGNYSKALETQLKAREIADRLNNPEKVETNLIFMGGVYIYSGDYQKALYYLKKTTGKNVGSVTLYDSPTFTSQNRNPNHKYAMQPIVLKIANAVGFSDYQTGLVADYPFLEDYGNLGVLGNPSEPLLNQALTIISNGGRLSQQHIKTFEPFTDSKSMEPLRSEMYVELK